MIDRKNLLDKLRSAIGAAITLEQLVPVEREGGPGGDAGEIPLGRAYEILEALPDPEEVADTLNSLSDLLGDAEEAVESFCEFADAFAQWDV